MARLVDSSVFIDVERKGAAIEELAQLLPGGELVLAAVTASELLAGGLLSTPGARRTRRKAFVEGVLAQLRVLPFDLKVAREYARVGAELRRVGQPIGIHDLQIAATALAANIGIVTGNPRDFSRITGLSIHVLRL